MINMIFQLLGPFFSFSRQFFLLFQFIHVFWIIASLYESYLKIQWLESILLIHGDCDCYSNGIIEFLVPIIFYKKNSIRSKIFTYIYYFFYISVLKMRKVGSIRGQLIEEKIQVLKYLAALIIYCLYIFTSNKKNSKNTKKNLSSPGDEIKDVKTDFSTVSDIRDFLKP